MSRILAVITGIRASEQLATKRELLVPPILITCFNPYPANVETIVNS